MLNDDEIVTSVQEESDPVEDEVDEDEDADNKSSKDPSNTDAFSALETAMEWYEQQSECCPTQLLLLKKIRDLAAENRRCTVKNRTDTAGSDVVQSGRPIFDDFFQHLWPYIGNNTANVVFQMVKRLWLIRLDQ
ncbi:uncharacterized protein TNCV_3055051 [Trichonephila clavipes]|nr:uncharacterized protein TNCV_3055051 [Trichonephila clavipes]